MSFCTRWGEKRSVRFRLKDGEEVVLGRDSDQCDISVPDSAASRRHCRISNADGRILLEDLGSVNGTRVNGQGVQRAEISAGDVIRIGRHEIFVGEKPPESGA